MADYHCPDSCNRCGEKNDINETGWFDGVMCECKTVCKICGHADYWAYGFFDSGTEIESKCKTYTN